MPFFGAHQSIAGGLHHAVAAAFGHDCESLQLFTKNSNQWQSKPITPEEAALFRSKRRAARLRKPMAHTSYLINLASPDPQLFQRSLDSFVEEMQRAESLGLAYLVVHPGAHTGSGEQAGLERVARALDQAQVRTQGFRVRVLLETTAGQGSCLGHRFEHLAHILRQVDEPDRLGVCFDTRHVFAAGYGLAPERDYRTTMEEFQRTVGFRRLLAFHVNDSRTARGSRRDRHAHIGRGELGLEAFRLLVNDPRFRQHPMILETPKEVDGKEDMDAVNLGVLRRLQLG